jgi:hypothetical protein
MVSETSATTRLRERMAPTVAGQISHRPAVPQLVETQLKMLKSWCSLERELRKNEQVRLYRVLDALRETEVVKAALELEVEKLRAELMYRVLEARRETEVAKADLELEVEKLRAQLIAAEEQTRDLQGQLGQAQKGVSTIRGQASPPELARIGRMLRPLAAINGPERVEFEKRLGMLINELFGICSAPAPRNSEPDPKSIEHTATGAGSARRFDHIVRVAAKSHFGKRRTDVAIKEILGSGFFDPQWYQAQAAIPGSTSDVELARHYLEIGWKSDLSAHPLFDGEWYLDQYPDVKRGAGNPLLHLIRSGITEGRSSHPLFDPEYYLDRNPDIHAAGIVPLHHFIQYGLPEGRSPHPLFDSQWYLKRNPDVRAAGMVPLIHFLQHGAFEGRAPHALFDPHFYLDTYPDVRVQRANPVIHFLRTGAKEGRSPHALFHTRWYLARYPDIRDAGVNALAHFIKSGADEGRSPHPLFDTSWYVAQYPEATSSGLNPLVHFLSRGERSPHPSFDAIRYREVCQLPAESNALMHFVTSAATNAWY